MALGITQVFVKNGFNIIIFSKNYNKFEELKRKLKKIFIEKLKLSEEVTELYLKKISYSKNLKDSKKTDFIIEAIIEDLEVKKEYFKELDNICKNDVVFATNTSSLSITELAASTKRPDKVIGMHFFNPVGLMKLVEITKGILTSDDTVNLIMDFCNKIEKEFVIVNETPGFIVNRLLIPMINEAINLVQENIASIEEIDKAMRLGANHPIGPLALSDLIGNDVVLKIMETIYIQTKDSKYRPAYLLRKYVSSGMLGRKSNQGFYIY